ncbi:MAG: hypothetical protein ACRED5_16395 [Propylenella sp.]
MSRFASLGALPAILAGALSLAGPVGAQDVLFAEGQNPDLRVEVRDLKRGDGGVVTLRLRLVNGTGDAFDPSCDMRDPGFNDSCGEFTGAYLLDAANKKKYTVVRDSEKKCVCSGLEAIEPGKKMNVWATFPAPPEGVTQVTVVVPLFEPIEGVPIN